jgi:hypothetical protein
MKEEIQIALSRATEEVQLEPPRVAKAVQSAESEPVAYCSFNEFLALHRDCPRSSLYWKIMNNKIVVLRDSGGNPVRPYQIGIARLDTWERLIQLRKAKRTEAPKTTKRTLRIPIDADEILAEYAKNNDIRVSQIFSKSCVVMKGGEICISIKY